MAAQQFSLRWNNYSQHIVTALEELRVDDELTDVTLSCEGQRVKAHKLLLSACSVFFKETFKENPCKHPVIILKGVTFSDLQAIVQFMYNGQVNVTQERLPSFLQTAEILQIKGLTDSTNNERDETTPVTKKRPQTFPSQAPATSDSLRQGQDTDARPPTPKRKRILGSAGTGGVFASAQNSELPGSASVISATTSSGVVTGGSSSSSSSHSNSNQTNSLPPPLIARANSENSGDGLPLVKYEDQDQEADEMLHYDRSALSDDNDNSFQDGIKDELGGDASLGSNIRSTNGAGERRPRYTLQPSNDQVTGVVDATNDGHQLLNGTTSRDLICDKPLSYVADMRKANNFVVATNGHCSKIKSRLTSRSLSSTALLHAQQEDRVIKYAPMQQHSQDSGSNSSHDGGDPDQPDDVSESPQGSDEEDEPHNRSSSSLLQKGRGMPHLVKAFHISQQQSQQINTIVNSQSHGINGSNGIYRGISASLPNVRGAIKSNLVADDLTVSSPSDISTPNFSLTQQLLQQNVLSMISSNGTTDVLKGGSIAASGGSNSSSSRVSAIAVQPLSQSGVMVKVEQPLPIVAPYVCDVCGKRYVHHRSLNDHKKSHTGATRCPVCNKSFSKVANMRAHYAAQHGNQQDEEGMDQTQQNGHLPVN